MEDKDDLIQSEGHFRHVQENMGKADVKETKTSFDHLAVLNQTLKVIDIIKMDPFIKVVLRKKLISPLLNAGKSRSNHSIALELGASLSDVDQAEAFGVMEIGRFLESTELQDAINKHNTDNTVDQAVKKMVNPNRN